MSVVIRLQETFETTYNLEDKDFEDIKDLNGEEIRNLCGEICNSGFMLNGGETGFIGKVYHNEHSGCKIEVLDEDETESLAYFEIVD